VTPGSDIHRPGGRPSVHLFDVLDRVLDKGIVVDPWLRASSLAGIELTNVDAGVLVVSVETCLERWTPAPAPAAVASPPIEP
jgi:hypothetical protein